MEVCAVLAVVGSISSGESIVEEGTLDVGGGCWVRAVGTRVKSRISLEVDVEGSATGPEAAALSGTVAGVVRSEGFVSEITSSGAGTELVLISYSVAGRSLSTVGSIGVDRISLESIGSVGIVRDWSAAYWLNRTLASGAECVSWRKTVQSSSIDG